MASTSISVARVVLGDRLLVVDGGRVVIDAGHRDRDGRGVEPPGLTV